MDATLSFAKPKLNAEYRWIQLFNSMCLDNPTGPLDAEYDRLIGLNWIK